MKQGFRNILQSVSQFAVGMKFSLCILCLIGCLMSVALPAEARRKKEFIEAEDGEKQEFRGVWIQTAFQDRFMRMSSADAKLYLEQMVEDLYKCGFNAIIFQVRPEGDAFYRSNYEPWSRFLTGKQGKAPSPMWDPMEYLIRLCHERHIEFHAWLNPYRMSASKSLAMAPGHLYYQHPEWFVNYGGKLYLNPGLPESRTYIRTIVKDIVKRYDVDAIHFDDYFYPYPGEDNFHDEAAFQMYGEMMGFDTKLPESLGAWRRRNVNILIKSVNSDIKELKPWVRFGVSPFGIYRNNASWKEGSKTKGTQCFDNLYADVLLWAQEGWIDYLIPQIYWEMGHQLADYTTLVKWWNTHTPERCQLYIGQSIERSLDDPKTVSPKADLRKNNTHFMNKINLARNSKNVKGMCFWYGYQIEDNEFYVADLLSKVIFEKAALPPAYTSLDNVAPEKVRNLDISFTGKGLKISWLHTDVDDSKQQEVYYCVYKFARGERVKTDDLSHLLLRTSTTEFYDYDILHSKKYTYVVTAVDPYNNESKPVKKTIKVKIK